VDAGYDTGPGPLEDTNTPTPADICSMGAGAVGGQLTHYGLEAAERELVHVPRTAALLCVQATITGCASSHAG
jgi:hypothetical protein